MRFNHQMIIFAETTRENLTGIVRSTSNFTAILTECMIQVYSRFENTRPRSRNLEKDIYIYIYIAEVIVSVHMTSAYA